jgi:ABC-type oligopeptide transport system substrate-binding subunit
LAAEARDVAAPADPDDGERAADGGDAAADGAEVGTEESVTEEATGEIGETDREGGTEEAVDEVPEQVTEEGVEAATEEETVPPLLERLTLTHNRGRTHAAIAQRMAADIEAVLGIEVDLDAQELEPFLQAVSAGEVPVFRLGWDPAEPQPGSYLRPLFHSSEVGVDNLTRYASEDVDHYLDEARTAAFPTVAEAWYRQAERRVLEDLPAMPLLWYRHQRVIGPEVRDLRISPLGRMSFVEAWLDSGQGAGEG